MNLTEYLELLSDLKFHKDRAREHYFNYEVHRQEIVRLNKKIQDYEVIRKTGKGGNK